MSISTVQASAPERTINQEELFEFTDNELLEMDSWKDKPLEDMLNDALKCNRAALYMTGMGFLTGLSGCTIDVDIANFYFYLSASLGFGPSIKQIIHTNIEDGNPFLVMVYCNLLASTGHIECVIPYHQSRKEMIITCGEDVCKEIERMAACKHKLILSNLQHLEETKDKEKYFLLLSHPDRLINSKDKDFNSKYWFRFSKLKTASDDLFNKFDFVLQNDFAEFDKMFIKSSANLSSAIKLLKKDETILNIKAEGMKDASRAIEKAKEIMILMDGFQQSSSETFKKIAHEFFLLCKNAKGVLEQHYSFFLSSEEFLSSEKSLSKLTECTAGVKLHRENIDELFRKLNLSTN